jgi:YVTN family beta-propeller protein
MNRVTNRIYTVNYGDDSVTVVDGDKDEVIATIKTGEGPEAIAVDTRANKVYIANTHSNTVTAIDGATNTVIATMTTGEHPFGLAVDAASGHLYSENFGDLKPDSASPKLSLDIRIPAAH